MSLRTTLAALLFLAAPLSAQTTASHRMGGAIYSGGPTTAQHRLRKPAGTSGGATSVNPPVSAAAVYDLGNSQEVIWGGVDFVAASTQYMAKTSGAIPGSSGGTPTYPLTVVGAFKWDTGTSAICFWHADTNTRMGVYTASNTLHIFAAGSGGNTDTTTAVSSVTAGRWHFFVAVFTSASSRAIYLDTDTTGATSAVTRAVTGVSEFNVGRAFTSNGQFDGEIGPIWILSGDLSGAGNANLRGAIFAGADPVRASRGVATLIAHYPMQAATGASQSGNYDLTPANSPTATSRLLVARDLSGNGRHVRATTAPPTFSSTQGNGQGGGAFASALSQFLVFDGSVPDVAPFQVYAVARTTTTEARGNVWWLGDKDSSNDSWSVEFDGTNALGTGDDRIVFNPFDTSTSPISGTTYSADTDYLIWALESSSTSRAVQVNGTNQATGSTDLSPDNADRFALGRYSASSPAVPLNGQIHYVILQTTSSTAGKTRIERFLGAAFNVSVP